MYGSSHEEIFRPSGADNHRGGVVKLVYSCKKCIRFTGNHCQNLVLVVKS